jgi:SNF2 family DNA or RNA helicase
VGWCLIARARKRTPLKGGVLGDAIGSGKTVVTIALILSGIENARSNCNISEGVSSASLIVVPPGLVKQWDDERKVRFFIRFACFVLHIKVANQVLLEIYG